MKKDENLNQTDALIKEGMEAMEKGAFNSAVNCFRKALHEAPFRQDIKDLLAMALDQRPVSEEPVIIKKKRAKNTIGKSGTKVLPKRASITASPKSGIRIGVWLLIFCALCISSVAFFFFFSSAIQSFVSNLARPKNEVQTSPAEREAAALYKSAELLQDQRRYSEAIEAIKKAIENNPANKKLFEDKLAELYFNQAEVYYNKKDDYKKAIDYYQKAVQYNPESTEYYYGLGWAYFIQGRKNQNRRLRYRSYFDKSLQAFLKVLERDPDNLRTKDSLARVYIARNETTKAAEMYRQIIRQSPDSRDAERARRALKSMGFKL